MDKKEIKLQEKTVSAAAGADRYPGVSVNIDDKEKVDSALENERVKVENNNPRNND